MHSANSSPTSCSIAHFLGFCKATVSPDCVLTKISLQTHTHHHQQGAKTKTITKNSTCRVSVLMTTTGFSFVCSSAEAASAIELKKPHVSVSTSPVAERAKKQCVLSRKKGAHQPSNVPLIHRPLASTESTPSSDIFSGNPLDKLI